MLWWTLRKLKSDDWKKKEQAIEVLNRSKESKAVKPLLAMLQDRNPQIRVTAVKALGVIGKVDTVEQIALALRDNISYVRIEAAKSLGEIGSLQAMMPLAAALVATPKDVSNSTFLENVTRSLVKIGGLPAVAPLAAMLTGGDYKAHWEAMRMQGGFSGPPTVEPLIAIISDRKMDYISQILAKEALGAIGPSALASLIESLKNENDIGRESAAWALGRIADTRAIEPLMVMLVEDTREMSGL